MADNGGGSAAAGLHILMFPFLAFGHISPFIQLARKISAADPTIRITFLSAPANVPRVSSLLPSTPSVSVLPVPLPAVPGLPSGAESTADLLPATAELLKIAVDLTKPNVESLLSQLKPHLVLHDFAQPWLPSISAPLGIKTLFFSVFAAIATAYLTVPSRLPSDDLKRPPIGFPSNSSVSAGVPAYQASDFTYMFQTFGGGGGGGLTVYDRVVACMNGCTAIVAKTCIEMEGQYVSYIESNYQKPVLLAGPVVPELPVGELDKKWAEWLDRFEEGSVVFCSFGSETALTDDGVRELTEGLSMTGLPFFVVLNSGGGGGGGGGEDEVGGSTGVIHRGWVQQQLILQHRSVGYFICHAGLSSVMEGVVAGCQVVMIPQRGDQFLNSALFAKDLEIGVEVKREEGSGMFDRFEVCKAVRKVTVGEEGRRVRENHRRWREFLLDQELQQNFTAEFLAKLKAIAGG